MGKHSPALTSTDFRAKKALCFASFRDLLPLNGTRGYGVSMNTAPWRDAVGCSDRTEPSRATARIFGCRCSARLGSDRNGLRPARLGSDVLQGRPARLGFWSRPARARPARMLGFGFGISRVCGVARMCLTCGLRAAGCMHTRVRQQAMLQCAVCEV